MHLLPNERTRSTQFLDSIDCSDPELLAFIAAGKKDYPGIHNSFELAVTFTAPYNPVAKNKIAGKRLIAEISPAFTDGTNKKLDTSGVELYWYKRKVFVALNDVQKE